MATPKKGSAEKTTSTKSPATTAKSSPSLSSPSKPTTKTSSKTSSPSSSSLSKTPDRSSSKDTPNRDTKKEKSSSKGEEDEEEAGEEFISDNIILSSSSDNNNNNNDDNNNNDNAEVKKEKSEEEEKRKMERAAYQSVKGMELQIEQLKEECGELNRWKEEAGEKIKSYQKSTADLKAEVEKLQKDKDELVKSFDKEKSKLTSTYEKEIEKLKKGFEKEKEELTEKMEEVSMNLESVSLDKEISEEQCNEFQREIEQLKGQIDILEANQSSLPPPSSSSPSSEEFDANIIKDLQENNDRLKMALMKLRDVSLDEKQSSSKRIKELEKENAVIPGMEEKLERLESALSIAETSIEELKEQLDAALEAESMIEEMTEKNMDLEQKVEDLQFSIDDLEALRDISEELEEQRAATEKKLRKDLNLKEIQLLDLDTTIDNLHRKLNEHDQTIDMFRSKVNELKNQLLEYQMKDQESSVEQESLEEKTSKLADENIQLRSKLDKYEAALIREEISLIDSSLSSKHLKSIFLFLPTDIIKKENDSLLSSLSLQRLEKKTSLIIHHVKSKYHIHDYLLPSTTDRNIDERYFGYKLIWQLSTALSYLQEAQLSFDHEKDVNAWLAYSSLQWDLPSFEHSIDKLLSSIQSNSLNETYPIHDLELDVKKIRSITSKHGALPDRSKSIDQIRSIVYTCQFTVLELHRIHRYLSLNLVQYNLPQSKSIVEAITRLEDFKPIVKKLMERCRKIIKYLYSDHLRLPNHSKVDQLNSLSLSISSISRDSFAVIEKIAKDVGDLVSNIESDPKSLSDLLSLLLSFISSAQNIQGDSISISSDNTSNNNTIADQSSSLDNNNDDNNNNNNNNEDNNNNEEEESNKEEKIRKEYRHYFGFLEKKLEEVERGLEGIYEMAEEVAGEEEKKKEYEEYLSLPSALDLHAASIKSELNSLHLLKQKITSLDEIVKGKEEEIANHLTTIANANRKQTVLETRIQEWKKKGEDLSQQLLSSDLEFKRQLKTYEDALVSMQEDVELLEQEKREMAEKLSQSRKFGGLSSADSKLSSSSDLSLPFELVSKEISSLREALHYLRVENSRLKSKSFLSSSSSSSHLSSLSLPSSRALTGEAVKDISYCKNELKSLNQQLFLLHSSPKVIDLQSPSSSSLSSSSSSSSYSRANDIAIINEKSKNLQIKIHSLIAQSSSSSNHNGDLAIDQKNNQKGRFAPMVDANVVHHLNDIPHNGKLTGKISVPLSSHLKDLLSSISPSSPVNLSLPQSKLKTFFVGI